MTYLNLGITGEALKWIFAVTRQESKDNDIQLVEKAKNLYQEIKCREKMRH